MYMGRLYINGGAGVPQICLSTNNQRVISLVYFYPSVGALQMHNNTPPT